ncbi:MAG TPA: hypothetical protein PK079_25095 [Leptospiraceae bacterium]|nr:hypothetical protein [Leptospiraceae bacterium]HMW08591.1 hypothetical protein [Leptospiraceae bacterium]HMZ66550.1 hypothetical protein [Leptospiraceae bacterium]HNA10230.1 hypothetical protein [Leptospiraceae bacterium]HNB98554.1 hypothetical protein [Leptospiraceae bacterium]
MPNKVFDLDSLSVTIIQNGVPIDISAGLTVDGDFIKVQKATKDEVKIRKGTKGETYSANSIVDNNRTIELTYIPTSSAVSILQSLRKTKEQFGILINSSSQPAWKLSASQCVISEEPDTVINGKDGFKDYTFKIMATDSEQIWL